MSDSSAPSAIEVVRKGRFTWDVVERWPGGIDTQLNQPFWFRRSADRYARREADRHRFDVDPGEVVSRIDLEVEREIGGMPACPGGVHDMTEETQ